LRGSVGEAWWSIDLDADGRLATPPRHTDIPRLKAGHVGAQF
jgi:hypothetical protein